MRPSVFPASDPALDALHHAFDSGAIAAPADGRVLFLNARAGRAWLGLSTRAWTCQQSFKPFADALEQSGLHVAEPEPEARFGLVLMLMPRQREAARALLARAVQHTATGGLLVTAIPNAEGARAGESDWRQLLGAVEVHSKHHCRILIGRFASEHIEPKQLDEWAALDALQPIEGGRFVSRPGLFAWDRIDPASALLIEHLPEDLHGSVADLGAGWGYLSCSVLQRCAQVRSIDLYEAESRALPAARANLERICASLARTVTHAVHWHDVRRGLPRRHDAIVSNPPFHQGRADQPELGRDFIEATAAALAPGGRFWMVANRHLPYEQTLAARFAHVRVLACAQGFKVFEAGKVRA